MNQIMNMFKGVNNPQQFVMNMFGGLITSNPTVANMVKSAQSGDVDKVKQTARNLFESQGRNFDEEFNKFMNRN
jgi:hypothetical protein